MVPEFEPARSGGARQRELDERFMLLALAQARAAAEEEEVPIGAVIARGEEVLAQAHNRVRADADPTAHAELLALRSAARVLGVPRLVDCVVYATVEPCFMCAGAMVHARVRRAVFAVRDPKFGACVSLGNVLDHPQANHRLVFAEGVLADEARALLQEFFRARRVREPGDEPGEST